MKSYRNELQEILLAGLLHDIGKFYQRAGYSFDLILQGDSYDYHEFTRMVKDGLKEKYYYQHAALTAKFFRQYLPEYDSAGVLAAYHHVPEKASAGSQRLMAKIISLADRMSSGERIKREEDGETGEAHRDPLISIFCRLKAGDQGQQGKKDYFVPLLSLNDDLSSMFPVEKKNKAFLEGNGQKAYKHLWDGFVSELKKLEKGEILIQLYYLLQKYTLTVPAAVYKDEPDISLFHHLKSTAAISAALYQLTHDARRESFDENYLNKIFEELRNLKQESKKDSFNYLSRPDFLLIGGDISGIQEFIYQVTSENALKGLKARSFYLQLISEILARKILLAFDLNEINILYCGGGNFYLLLPNLSTSEQKLREIQSEIDKVMLRAHKGKLAAVLSWVPLSYYDFFQDFAGVWQEVGKKLALNKKKKFSSLIWQGDKKDFVENVLGPYDEGGKSKGCNICGDEIAEDAPDICGLCNSFIDLAKDLNRAKYLVFQPIEKVTLPAKLQNWWEVTKALGYECRFLSAQESRPGYKRHSYLINSVDFAGQADGFMFIARKTPASESGQLLTLEDLAEAATGIKKWGVIRADVDRLGELFQNGLENNKTISRVSMLSTMLSLYFSARMSQVDKWAAPYSSDLNLANVIYLAYSGGDDLFLIGPWSVLIGLAACIRDDFSRFTCERLTISAGVFYAPGKKFPVYQAASMSGEAEEQAKHDGRNRINVFGESLDWKCLPVVEEITNIIKDLLHGKNGKAVPRSLLDVLYNIYHEKQLKKENKIKMERVWRLHYSLRKLKANLNEKQNQELHKLMELILVNYEIYPYLNIATRVADYLTR